MSKLIKECEEAKLVQSQFTFNSQLDYFEMKGVFNSSLTPCQNVYIV